LLAFEIQGISLGYEQKKHTSFIIHPPIDAQVEGQNKLIIAKFILWAKQ